ncbi:YqaE/Pmp3 family membrane protein [Leptodesmis sp.]|uniref:YqaE/Pmp3 family membrane protein n=1 Tax=Leptodesmis sp. TaxID=3100501 RepID=UPI00405356EB
MRLILGIVLPPLGVFLTFGIGPTLIINILLTLVGWVPGSIHAVWAIAKHEEQMAPIDRGAGI